MRYLLSLVALLLLVSPVSAQITVPNTFVAGTTISASQMNANFDALESEALNRNNGTITGNITVSSGVTIDGVDISASLNQAVSTTSSPTFSALTVTNNASVGGTLTTTGATALNSTLDVASSITAGSGNVTIVNTDGKIPSISSTYFASLDISALTRSVRTETTTYSVSAGDDVILANGTFTITLPAVADNTGRVLEIKNVGTGTVTVDGNSSETIDGATTLTIDGQYFSYTLYCTGSEWVII